MSFIVGEQRAENLGASPPFICIIIHAVSLHSLSLSLLNASLTRRISGFCSSRSSTSSYLPPCSFDNDSFSLPLSVSIPLFHCPFTSLHLSTQHQSFSSGIELLCLPPRLPRSSSQPAITAYLLSPLPSPPPLHLCLTGYIGSSLRCLGLWQPVSYSK